MSDERRRVHLRKPDIDRAVNELSATPRRALETLTLEEMETYGTLMGEVLDGVLGEADLPIELVLALQGTTLAASFPVLVLTTLGRPREAAWLLFELLRDQCGIYGLEIIDVADGERPADLSVVEPKKAHELTGALNTWLAAVSRYTRERRHAIQASAIIYRLMEGLDLSRTQVGRMFDVSGESVRRWERGMVEVPAEKMASLTLADAALSRLIELFEPDRLALVIRRPAELFGGESALDWILRGRLADVADRYEQLLAYQA